ncbi:histidinol-phosphate transaminase [Leifsonia sp. H3M29-4]|uniref:histidinol-phosphate transaminase n=1 Tax=Salinibacterium metalliresistens TaxID=3031321 RepID=UPI0023DA21B1|nr:histidinol-phosphate transaminase [Salinibacterium metalliresistens]MDF1477672.1 histidinol-phosphate transaminase [Salinibacterium metalliresistens]
MSSSRVRLRPEIESIVPYRQGRTAAEDAFKLSSNENPFPPIPAVLEAIAASAINRYPEGSAAALRERLGARFGVSPEWVQVGAGSVSVLAQLISAAAAPGDEVLYSWRSFEAYPLLVATSGATAVQVPNTADHRHDLTAMAAAVTDRTRMVIVCSPNNPTSTVVTDAEFAEFMAAVPATVLVVLDEAYVEFVTDPDAVDGASLIGRYPNLVILRTFSKAYGLAGLRIGYAIGAEYLMDAARATAIPLSVTEPAQRAAIAALEHEAELLARVAELNERRERLWAGLVEQGWSTPRPQGNFVWLPTGVHTAHAAEILASHGIVARPLGEGVRVSVGEPESVETLLRATAEVVAIL